MLTLEERITRLEILNEVIEVPGNLITDQPRFEMLKEVIGARAARKKCAMEYFEKKDKEIDKNQYDDKNIDFKDSKDYDTFDDFCESRDYTHCDITRCTECLENYKKERNIS